MSRVIPPPTGPSKYLPGPGRDIEERHLRAAVNQVADAIVRHGEKYAPLLERLERELVLLQTRQRPIDRARRILEAQTADGGTSAIR